LSPETRRGGFFDAAGKNIGRSFLHQDRITDVAFSLDGKAALTGSADNTALLWNVATGELVGLPLEHQDAVFTVAFSPDGKAVLTSSDDNTARLWDAATGKPIGPPFTHQGRVTAVAFSPDGKAVLTGSDDKTARVWTIAELPDDLRRLEIWVEFITGLHFDRKGSVRTLDNLAWQQRRERLRQEGGPPETDNGDGSTPSSSAPNPRPAHRTGSSESGGPRP
jgi:eukaryotic-like serine/threonine-protein kinase